MLFLYPYLIDNRLTMTQPAKAAQARNILYNEPNYPKSHRLPLGPSRVMVYVGLGRESFSIHLQDPLSRHTFLLVFFPEYTRCASLVCNTSLGPKSTRAN
jgi:hypothetical protein